ncbi:CadC family transcriptional regulator [Serratia oryzae]|uniref:CadC family transcriptional regulator n=1 Tax=Serratia oryzae TaxID=2034155 RepID=UPI000F78E167|nr:CadC family transcriptional regulator [Serratia oryzae]
MIRNGKSDLKLCGYTLGGEVLFYLEDRVLINFSKNNLNRTQLRTTMANLLIYLLNNSRKDYIVDDEIMSNVWELNNLQASSHRLWQVSKDLKLKLLEVGLSTELFYRTERRGFSVNRELVTPIYCDHTTVASRIQSDSNTVMS